MVSCLIPFFFSLKFRAGIKGARPDALSLREQDVPKSPDDPRLKEREFQLLKDNFWQPEDKTNVINLALINGSKIPAGENLFEDEELQNLWNKGVKEDKHFEKLYSSIWQDQRIFPTELGLKTSLSKCTLYDRGALCFIKRLWVPEWEPL